MMITSWTAVVPGGPGVAPVVFLSSTLASVRARLVVSSTIIIRTNMFKVKKLCPHFSLHAIILQHESSIHLASNSFSRLGYKLWRLVTPSVIQTLSSLLLLSFHLLKDICKRKVCIVVAKSLKKLQ